MSSKKIRIDPHVHSEGSYDCDEPIEEIVEHVNEIDLDAAVITDHNTIEKSLEAVKISEYYDNAIFLPGVEVSSSDGHVLAIGVEECPEKGQPFMDTVEEIRRLGGVAAVPHPFQRSRHGVAKKKIEDCDAIEIFNSAWVLTGWQNHRARKFAKRRGYAGIAGSDAHHISSIGRAFTELEVEKRFLRHSLKNEDIEGAMKGGYSSVEGKKASVQDTMHNYAHYSSMKTKKKASQAEDALITMINSIF